MSLRRLEKIEASNKREEINRVVSKRRLRQTNNSLERVSEMRIIWVDTGRKTSWLTLPIFIPIFQLIELRGYGKSVKNYNISTIIILCFSVDPTSISSTSD
ncbi:unnamed protein product [Macrosiphum euphorbiae]|uniref:Translocon at the inner envelope membrane of chloroplasts 214 n=1 Tax=Macrosiphum euphorbiae TaxID=13131 RepID=A0AAV0VUB3_9HEMI|nr:unnamed protein product [Macrosiphum euphorbiae]